MNATRNQDIVDLSSEEPTSGFSGSKKYDRKDKNSDDAVEYVKVTAS